MSIDRKNIPANESANESARASDASRSTLVDTVFDVGLAWAAFGVGQGRMAIETSAKTLEKIAQSLGELQGRLRRDVA